MPNSSSSMDDVSCWRIPWSIPLISSSKSLEFVESYSVTLLELPRLDGCELLNALGKGLGIEGSI